jgi:dienelactone hydrolase
MARYAPRTRRRSVLSLGLVACLAAGCSSADAARSHDKPSTSTEPAGTSTGAPAATAAPPPPTTTLAPPTTTTVAPSTFDVGITTVTWVNPDGVAVDYATGGYMARTLVTEIRYPTVAGSAGGQTEGAVPAYRFGPYPVIVFAHGYDLTPDDYDPLLDSWVRAGFVVVAPLFPDENGNEVAALGGPYSSAGFLAQHDLPNEPGDLAYVIKQVDAAAGARAGATSPPGVSLLRGLVDARRLGLAGQSDGGDAVAALAYDSSYAALETGLATPPLAVAALSAAEIGGAGSYATAAHPPPLLVVQSATDQCNPPEDSTQLYGAVAASAKWFLEIDQATHLGPYTGQGDAAPAVEAVTTDFFETQLGWRAPPAAGIRRAGDVAGISSISSSARPPVMAWLEEDGNACGP